MVPRVIDNNRREAQSRVERTGRDTSKFQKWSPFIDSRRRYMAELLRKTLYNQSIELKNMDFFLFTCHLINIIRSNRNIHKCYRYSNINIFPTKQKDKRQGKGKLKVGTWCLVGVGVDANTIISDPGRHIYTYACMHHMRRATQINY